VRLDVHGTSSGSCDMSGFGIYGVEPLWFFPEVCYLVTFIGT
jgi:hypothetical protein